MRYATKLSLLVITLCALTVIASALTVWSAREGQWLLVRSELAHLSYESYLRLAAHVRGLDALPGDSGLSARPQGNASDLVGELHELRAVHEAEYDWVGEAVAGELDELARLEEAFEAFVAARDRGALEQAGQDTNSSRQVTAGPDAAETALDGLIAQALTRESLELAATRRAAQKQSAQRQALALAWAVLALLGSSFAWFWMVRDFRKPIERLIAEADRVARGDWQEPVLTSSSSELDRVGLAFNHMAAEIRMRQDRLESSNQALGAAVAERTAELEGLLRSLQQSEARRRQLLADVSHELRTPLTILRGEADVVLRGGDKPVGEYREALERSREAAAHMARLVDDLLFMSRHEAQEMVLEKQSLDLVALLRGTLAGARSVLGGMEVKVSIAADCPPVLVQADPVRLRQVLLVLLDNAARYGGQHVEVSLSSDERCCSLLLSDDGPGLSTEEVAQVFERFYRGGNAAVRYSAGAGLGLPVAKAIMEAHAGTIVLDSKPGHGLRATLTLPLDSVENQAA
ncbi:MAG: hypothetical protein RL434_1513 [Pseudomonadota bacterium]